MPTEKTWRVDGMHCPHCETAVRNALKNTAGLGDVKADWQRGTLTARWDDRILPESVIDARLREAGYSLLLKSPRKETRSSLLRLLVLLVGGAAAYFPLAHTSAAGWTQTFPLAREGMGYDMLFLAGVATSLHCIAMCGGINMAQSAASARNGVKPGRANLLYNLGRLVSYTFLGGIIGGVGMVFSFSSKTKAAIQLFAAAFMIGMAANLSGGFPWLKKLLPRLPESIHARILGRASGKSSFIIGLANGLMPCGPLQAMQLYSLSAGSWRKGALSMFFFCLGTIPLMLGFGFASGKLMRRFAKPMRIASSALVLVMGVNALVSGLSLIGAGGIPAAKPAGSGGTAVIEDGRQYVYSELDYGGYPVITVRKGFPVEWTIHAKEGRITSCNNELYIPAYNLSVKLHSGDNVIKFTPEKSGSIPYTCWMGMIRSAIYVNPS